MTSTNTITVSIKNVYGNRTAKSLTLHTIDAIKKLGYDDVEGNIMTTNTNREAYFRDLAVAEIDDLISAGPDYLWLVTSGFENADDCCPDGGSRNGQAGPDGWNRGGYWEFVYTSIASLIDAHIGRDAFDAIKYDAVLARQTL